MEFECIVFLDVPLSKVTWVSCLQNISSFVLGTMLYSRVGCNEEHCYMSMGNGNNLIFTVFTWKEVFTGFTLIITSTKFRNLKIKAIKLGFLKKEDFLTLGTKKVIKKQFQVSSKKYLY